jgi:hypothetical protein
MYNNKDVIDSDYYEDSQKESDDIEQKIGELYCLINDTIKILEIENKEFLNIVDKDFNKTKNNSLINSIGRYVLKNDNSTKPEPSSHHKKLKVISFSLSPFMLPFLFPLMISTSFSFDNIDFYLEIREEYIYDGEDKETPIDMQIIQSFIVDHILNIKSHAGIYLPFGLGNMHLEFVFNGVLSRTTTKTNIKINILNNTYLIEFNGTISKNYSYYLRIGMMTYILFIPVKFDSDIFNFIMVGSKTIIDYVQNSFREPLLDNNALEAISYFSYSNTDLEQIKKLKEQN